MKRNKCIKFIMLLAETRENKKEKRDIIMKIKNLWREWGITINCYLSKEKIKTKEQGKSLYYSTNNNFQVMIVEIHSGDE